MIQISEMALAFTKQLQGQLCERKYSSMKSNVADNNRKWNMPTDGYFIAATS